MFHKTEDDMTEQALDTKIVERIKKLLALSRDGGATEAEANLAAEKAGELMRAHNLSMATLEAAGGTAEGGKRTEGRAERRAMYKWQQNLMATVGHVNFCHVDVMWGKHVRRDGSMAPNVKSTPRGYRLIGREANVVAATEMFDYLIESITRILMVELNGDSSRVMSRFANSFREGCSDRLRERLVQRHDAALAEQRKAAQQANAARGSGNALTIVLADFASTEADLNRDHRFGKPPGYTAEQRAIQNAKAAQRKERIAALVEEMVANGLPRDVAELLASGECDTPAEAEAYLRPKPKHETEAQKRKRLEREEREFRRWQDRERRRDARTDWRGYERGAAAGDGIGLDAQVSKKNTERLS